MVLNAREKDHVAHIYDLVRALLDILRDVYKNYNHKADNRLGEIQSIKAEKSDIERKICKNLEIVIDLFGKATEKVGKIGEREWKEVFEQQTSILEDIINI